MTKMRLSEGLLLAACLPLCRKQWDGDDGESGCILRNLAKVVGVSLHLWRGPNANFVHGPYSVLEPYQALIPHFPTLAVVLMADGVLAARGARRDKLVADEIIDRFDGYGYLNPWSVDEIVAWVQTLEAEQAQRTLDEAETVSVAALFAGVGR